MSMTEHAPSGTATDLVKKEIFVKASPEHAYRVFTEGMSTWWPLATHKLSKGEAVAVVVEPFVGGRMAERAADGSECTWGRVLVWDVPRRFVFSWEINGDFQVDSSIDTEVEVTFTPENGGTRVRLEHRKLAAYGARAEEMKKIFGSEGGWQGILSLFGRQASSASSSPAAITP